MSAPTIPVFSPPNTPLTWEQVEDNLEGIETGCLAAWREVGLDMPDEAASDLKLETADILLASTAEALGIPPWQVPWNPRVQWMTEYPLLDKPFTLASLDGKPMVPLKSPRIYTINPPKL